MNTLLLLLATSLTSGTIDSTLAGQPATSNVPQPAALTVSHADSMRRRPRAIEHSEAYYQRLTIHRIGSYTMLPLFAIEYPLGQKLLRGTNPPSWIKPAHAAVAGGIGALFVINTVTGAWNGWEARNDEDNRGLRIAHELLMLAADGGFVWTGVLGAQSRRSYVSGNRHRTVAIGSMSVATAGTALMWFWKH